VADLSFTTGSAASVRADLLILPVFAGPEPGPGVKEAGLQKAFAAAKLTGKRDEQLLVTAGDGFAAGAVLLVGVGDKKGFDANRLRVALGKAAPTAARFATIATTFPQAVTGRGALEAVQATAEGLLLGTYRFDRYRTTAKDLPKPIRKVTVLGGARADAKAARAAL
jgi:leucyl aminopeptidase